MSKSSVVVALSIAMGIGAIWQVGQGAIAATTDGVDSAQPEAIKIAQSSSQQQTSSTQSWQTNPATGIGGPYQPRQVSPANAPAAKSPATTSGATNPNTGMSVPPRPSMPEGRPIPGFPGYPIRPAVPQSGKQAPIAAAVPATTTGKKSDDNLAVQQGVNVGRIAGWNRFEDYINMQNGQEQMNPLDLVITNGSGGSPFTLVKVLLSGRAIASEKNFKNGVLSMSMVGALGNGANQLIINGYGAAGARISWKVIGTKASVTAVDPKDVVKAGSSIGITGKNFSLQPSANQVWIGKSQLTVSAATATSLKATVPDNVESGEQNLIVRIAGVDTKPFKVTVQGRPEVTGCNLTFIGFNIANEPLVITGKGFSAKASDNEVLIGSSKAQVTSASTTSLTCTLSETDTSETDSTGQSTVSIVVKTKGVASTGNVNLTVSPRLKSF